MGHGNVDNSEDIMDSRDIIARIDELENDLQGTYETDDIEGMNFDTWLSIQDTEDLRELSMLRKLADECEGYADDWQHGASLIRDSYFQKYAEQFADDIGAIDRNATWPCNCIDWERATHELQMDYTSVDFDGVTYWVR